jgi:hypothetical protein
MIDYESCNNNATVLKRTLPSGDILDITFLKKEGYLGTLNIEFIIYQDVFYPVTETVKLNLNTDRSYITESKLSKDISVKEIKKIVTAITAGE